MEIATLTLQLFRVAARLAPRLTWTSSGAEGKNDPLEIPNQAPRVTPRSTSRAAWPSTRLSAGPAPGLDVVCFWPAAYFNTLTRSIVTSAPPVIIASSSGSNRSMCRLALAGDPAVAQTEIDRLVIGQRRQGREAANSWRVTARLARGQSLEVARRLRSRRKREGCGAAERTLERAPIALHHAELCLLSNFLRKPVRRYECGH
jgi:hypothetical protein